MSASLGENNLNQKGRPKSIRLQAGSSKLHGRLVEYFVVVSSVPQNDPSDTVVILNSKNGNGKDSDGNENNGSEQIEIPIEEEIEKQLNFEASITSRYPIKDHEKNPLLHESVVSFCHSSEEIKLQREFSMPKVCVRVHGACVCTLCVCLVYVYRTTVLS